MEKHNTSPFTGELLIVAGVVTAFTALGFLAGLIFASRKKQHLVVTEKGELEVQEVEA